MEELHNAIKNLTGSEARSLLFGIMYQIKSVKDSDGKQEEIIQELYSLYDKILGVAQNKNQVEREYKTIHIVCGESPAGSLRVGLGRENKVIGFPDNFGEGPIFGLHDEIGRTHRYEWLRDHLNFLNDYMEEEYEKRFANTLAEISAIPDYTPIILWTAENANEQTGLRYILYLLKDKKNDVHLINTTKAYQELFNTSEFQYFYFQTGEVHPDKLNLIYQKKLAGPLSQDERIEFAKEWSSLSHTKEVLRVWEGNRILAVNEDYFDELLVSTAKELKGEANFIKSGRLIGEVYGRIDSCVGDAFLEYRLRSLIYNGVFKIKGIPKGMRYYSVKLRV